MESTKGRVQWQKRVMDTALKIEGFEPVGSGFEFRKEVCQMIADTQLFEEFPWVMIEDFSWYVQTYHVKAGTTVFLEGDPGTFMCVIVSGQVEILKADENGNPQRIAVVSKGKTFGEMALIDSEKRSATCVTTQDSTLLALTEALYERILRERPALAARILAKLAKLMSQRLRSASGLMLEHLHAEDLAGLPHKH